MQIPAIKQAGMQAITTKRITEDKPLPKLNAAPVLYTHTIRKKSPKKEAPTDHAGIDLTISHLVS